MPKCSSNQPADQRRRRSLITTVTTQCSIRPSIRRSPQYPVHAAQRAPGLIALTWFGPPVEAFARGVAAEQSPATWSHRLSRLSRRFHLQNNVSVLPLIRDIFERAKRLSEEKQLAEEVQFTENHSLNVSKLFSRKIRTHRKTQHPILRDALGNLIVDAQLAADSFNAFLSKTFIEDSTTPLLTIQALTGTVLENITFTLWDVAVAIRRFRQSYSPGPDGVPFTVAFHSQSLQTQFRWKNGRFWRRSLPSIAFSCLRRQKMSRDRGVQWLYFSVTLTGFLCTFFATILPYWYAKYPSATTRFLRLGFWEICLKDFIATSNQQESVHCGRTFFPHGS
ncbi:hypothetical protein SprV_0902714100 [Sparganum proliferum]